MDRRQPITQTGTLEIENTLGGSDLNKRGVPKAWAAQDAPDSAAGVWEHDTASEASSGNPRQQNGMRFSMEEARGEDSLVETLHTRKDDDGGRSLPATRPSE
ncbi:hypothetical protein VNO80_10321 [Phaseolus coccineus]|uniref:Uncharacterized protein n=1 Tax=Phaseolus coccineus TaxID=3886 RepID=A0AAN9N8G4_PHACN